MQFTPHDYQRHTTDFIVEHKKAAVFLGMGLGKTVSTLTAIDRLMFDRFEVQRVLVIAPKKVAENTWTAELEKWEHLTDLRASVAVGTAKQRRAALAAGADITVINVENVAWLIDEVGSAWPFDMVVIDELSMFKSPTAKRFKRLKHVADTVDRMVGLTGTPSPNGLADLWAPFRLLDGGQRLGKYITHFRSAHMEPDKRSGHRVFSWKLKPGADWDIYRAIGDITVSMKTTDYLKLPPMTITQREVEMSAAEMRTYRRLKRDMLAEVGGEVVDAGGAAALSNKLMQMASGAVYGPDGRALPVHGRKVEMLSEIVDTAAGNSVLVAYWFQHELDRLVDALPQARMIRTPKDVRDWNAGRIPLAFIHPASAGHGLNLQDGGHILVWFTVPWSLELFDQTNARLFRQGQKEPVSVVQLVCKGTVDEEVLKALDKKDMTQQALMAAVKAEVGR